MDLNVLTIDENIALLGDPSEAAQYVGRPCPVKQGSTDLVGGQVRVTDSHGAVVALGKVGSDPKMIPVTGSVLASPLACELSFTVDSVPDTDGIYTVQLAQKPGVTFTREQLSAPIELSSTYQRELKNPRLRHRTGSTASLGLPPPAQGSAPNFLD